MKMTSIFGGWFCALLALALMWPATVHAQRSILLNSTTREIISPLDVFDVNRDLLTNALSDDFGLRLLASENLSDVDNAGASRTNLATHSAANLTIDTLDDARLSANVSLLGSSIGTSEIENNAVTYEKFQDITATQRALGRNTAGSGDVEELTISQLLDWVGSAAQGDIIFRGAAGWELLPAGTGGTFLQTQGTGADPLWAAPAGGGTVTHTAGALTLDQPLLGAGGDDIKSVSEAAFKAAVNLEIGTDVQAQDSDLQALADNATAGILTRTGAGTAAARTLTGDAEIVVTNGDGVSGNPTFSIAPSIARDSELPTRDTLGLDTDDSPTFAGIEFGSPAASATTNETGGLVLSDPTRSVALEEIALSADFDTPSKLDDLDIVSKSGDQLIDGTKEFLRTGSVLHNLGNVGTDTTIPWTTNGWRLTVTDGFALTVSGSPPAADILQGMVVRVQQDGIGGHPITYAGAPLNIDTTANAVTYITFITPDEGSSVDVLQGGPIVVQEEDGDPLVVGINRLRFPNGSLTDNGNGDVSVAGVGGSGAFSDSADPVVLNTETKDVRIGPTGPATSKLAVNNDADQPALTVRGNATQTTSPEIVTVEKSDGTDIFSVRNDGSVNVLGTTAGSLKLTEASGTDFVGIRAPAGGVTASYQLALPAAVSFDGFLRAAATASEVSAVTVVGETGEGKVVRESGAKTLLWASGLADDTWTGEGFTVLNNSGGVTQWDAVLINGSSQWVLADADGTGTFPALGLATHTASTGVATEVVVRGTVRNDGWSWTPGGTVYLSTTAGGLTQTAPSTTGDAVQVIGTAISATFLYVNPGQDYATVQ